MTLFLIAEIVLFVIFAVNILYLAIFSAASLFRPRVHYLESPTTRRIAILVPAYREDRVIMDCVESCLGQQYPRLMFDIIVISDRMEQTTNTALNSLNIKLMTVNFKNSTKAKALNFAMRELDTDYDLALILDADNIISPDFLSQLNDAFNVPGTEIIQAHRCAKNTNNPLAMLDAVSEEINNNIFRKGHVKLGFSAALIGSGMCFDYRLFRETMTEIDAVGGFDRALELALLYRGKKFHYLPQLYVLDEKVHQTKDFSHQRRRWFSAQLHYLMRYLKFMPRAMVDGKWDFCDKLFQQMIIPRVMLLGFCTIITATITLIDSSLATKWWIAFGVLIVSLLIAVPRRFIGKQLAFAICKLPYFFGLLVLNLFRLKGANKTFLHTSHGVKK